MKNLFVVLCLGSCLFFSGCAARLAMKPSQVSRLKSNEGVVMGSFKFSDNEAWNIDIKGPYEYQSSIDRYVPSKGFGSIVFRTKRGESPFVSKLSAGYYWIYNIYCQGMVAKRRVPAGYLFEVVPGQTNYIGQLHFDLQRVRPSLANQHMLHNLNRPGTVTLKTGTVFAEVLNKKDELFEHIGNEYNIDKDEVKLDLIK